MFFNHSTPSNHQCPKSSASKGAVKIGGHDVYQLIGANPGKPPMRLFFDKESGLLLRSIRYGDTPLGRNPTQVDYTDYRAQDGVKVPFQ